MSLSQRLDVPPRLEMARSSDDREAQYGYEAEADPVGHQFAGLDEADATANPAASAASVPA